MKSIRLVVRPPSDEVRMSELRAAVAAVRERGHSVSMQLTVAAGDAREFARVACLEGCDVVAAAGGDGTVNEVVNGMVAARGGSSRSKSALAVIPTGTANDFARGLGVTSDLHEALRVAVEGVRRPVDVARVNGRCFINVSTGGFGAEATQAASRGVKRRLGRLAYLLEGARKLAAFSPGRAEFRVDGVTAHDGAFIFFAVGNASLTGGGTRIAPRADMGDGRLDIVVVCGASRLDFLSLLPDLRAGTHLESPDVSYFRAHTFDVYSDEPVPLNADGEPLEGRRFRYDVLSEPLPVMIDG